MSKKYTVGFISLGCSKNLVDSETMIGLLEKDGFVITGTIEEADVIVVNTCAFIDKAKKESIDAILEAAAYKKGRCRVLICAGCLAERYKEDIMREMPELDAVIGVNDFDKIAQTVRLALKGTKTEAFGGDAARRERLPRKLATPAYTAYLKIAEGCDKFCSYCAIPYIRGRFHSRRMDDIVKEARSLVKNGVRELIVIAQDTGCYGKDLEDGVTLAELLTKLCHIRSVRWVRLHYCYPEEVTDELIETFKREEKLVNYFDIPIQHCDDTILKRMNRKTTGEAIRLLIERLREEIPDAVIRTSLIAGFPGETEKQFEALCAFVKEMRFDRLGAFAYSAEEGTKAAAMDGQLSEEEKEYRVERLMAIQKEVAGAHCQEKLGMVLTVLVEGFDDECCLYYGRSYADSPEVDAKVYFGAGSLISVGDFVKVKILDYVDYDLTGEMIYE